MRKRGRKSGAELSVVPIDCNALRQIPPKNMAREQAQIWTTVVNSTPAGWFRENDVLLELYCRHVHTADRLAKLIDSCGFEFDDLRQLNRLLAMRARETSLTTRLATKMRLTQQARITPRSAGRKMENVGPRPWERPCDD